MLEVLSIVKETLNEREQFYNWLSMVEGSVESTEVDKQQRTLISVGHQ